MIKEVRNRPSYSEDGASNGKQWMDLKTKSMGVTKMSGNHDIVFETERLIIRPMKREDCGFAFDL